MKNVDKYQAAKDRLNERALIHAGEVLGGMPDHLWATGYPADKYEPEKWEVTGVNYHILRVESVSLFFDKRPSNEQVASMERISEMPLELKRIFLHVRVKRERFGTTSAAVNIPDLQRGNKYSTTEDAVKARAVELQELYLTKDGQFKCRYCGKATDNDKKHVGTVIAAQYPGGRKDFDYCSGRCAGHDQMAHEG